MTYRTLLENNRRWAAERAAEDPNYFPELAREHKPHCLFIGCSDARVPLDVITQAAPGELFVVRNIANQAHATDASLLSAVQYAVDVLKVNDIVVCGHKGCGGVRAAAEGRAPSLVETWVAGVRTVMRLHDDELSAIADDDGRLTRLVELNVVEQVFNLSRVPSVQTAWANGGTLRIHGWVYGLHSGLLRDLHVTMDGTSIAPRVAVAASARVASVAPRADAPLRRTG
jgi:carbonic anhydrase